MSGITKSRRVTISELDYLRLRELLLVAKQFAVNQLAFINDLECELERATIVLPEQIRPDVVTMNTRVRLTDVLAGKSWFCTLVFPGEAELSKENLSIFSELGAAILGYSVGDIIEWVSPDGVKRIRVDMIEFQPEATKQYSL
jgi:regulator of nucleoside diphosphate kinase